MKLLNELQERRRVLCEARDVTRADLLQTEAELYDLDRAIGALEPAAKVMPEPEPELQDDASEFSEEGYAPVIEPEPSALTTWGQHEELRAAGFVPVGAPDDDGPVKWERRGAVTEPEPTKPEADSIAKALDHYDPKAMADRDRFNPFGMFRKEGDQ